MKSILLGLATVSMGLVVGCGGASRTPDQYRTDTQSAFAAQEAEIKTCYDAVLASKADAKGDVTIQFVWSGGGGDTQFPAKARTLYVGEAGKEPAAVNVTNASAPEEVVKCVTDSVVKARLTPAGSGAGEATWTFHFAPGEAPTATETTPAS